MFPLCNLPGVEIEGSESTDKFLDFGLRVRIYYKKSLIQGAFKTERLTGSEFKRNRPVNRKGESVRYMEEKYRQNDGLRDAAGA